MSVVAEFEPPHQPLDTSVLLSPKHELELEEPEKPRQVNKATAALVAEVAGLSYGALLAEAKKIYGDAWLAGDKMMEGENITSLSLPSDNMALYLREIGRVQLLGGHRQEFVLGRIIEIGQAAQQALTRPDLHKGQRADLERRVAEGMRAREHFILANTRLVVKQAKGFDAFGIFALPDIVQVGNEGLFTAVDRYQWRLGYKFSTYAMWWIRQAIMRAFHYEVSVNPDAHLRLKTLVKLEETLTVQLGHPPTDEEIAQALFDAKYPDGLPEGPRQKALARACKWVKKQKALRQFLSPVELAEVEMQDDDDLTPEERLMRELHPSMDQIGESTEREATQSEMSETMDDLMARVLTDREQQVIELRFGLRFRWGDGVQYTLEEIGKIMGTRRERIRQIEGKALRKLRHPTRSGTLRVYLTE